MVSLTKATSLTNNGTTPRQSRPQRQTAEAISFRCSDAITTGAMRPGPQSRFPQSRLIAGGRKRSDRRDPAPLAAVRKVGRKCRYRPFCKLAAKSGSFSGGRIWRQMFKDIPMLIAGCGRRPHQREGARIECDSQQWPRCALTS